jgi:hypothetical protein
VISAIQTNHTSGPTPLLVTSTGRSGSSLFMGRLAAHPNIIVGGDHPHETKMIFYYTLAFRTLVSEADRERSSHPDTMGNAVNRFAIGFNPFNDAAAARNPLLSAYFNKTAPTILAESFRLLIAEYYEAVRMGTGKTVMRYFAEKVQPNLLTRQTAELMFGSIKEIVLVRDPRDLLCSYKSFWNSDPTGAVTTINTQLDYIARLRAEQRSDTLFVKYEDLTLQPDATLDRVCDFLEVPHHQLQREDREAAVFTRHGTSKSPEASVGRWRDDLSGEELALASDKFSKFLEVFEYSS